MAVDLTKLVYHSNYPAFKNDTVYTGTLTISGTASAGVNTRTFNVSLDRAPDLVDIIFNGPSVDTDPRPNDGWFKLGAVKVVVAGNDTPWIINSKIANSTLVVQAVLVQESGSDLAITSQDFSYRVVDYSVF